MSILKIGAKSRIDRELDRAAHAMSTAVEGVRRAVELTHELEAPPTPTEIEAARSDGWLSVTTFISMTPLLNSHEDIRAELLVEIERCYMSVEEGSQP